MPHGVMVAQQILNLLVKVRVLVRQPFNNRVYLYKTDKKRFRRFPFHRMFLSGQLHNESLYTSLSNATGQWFNLWYFILLFQQTRAELSH